MTDKAGEIIELARRAKAFIEAAGEGPVADERLVRAATAYNMMVRQGQIAESKHPDLDVPHAIATIAANFADYPASTKHRAVLFATKLDGEAEPAPAPGEPSNQLDLLAPPVPAPLDYSEPPPGWSPVVAMSFEDGTFFRSAPDSGPHGGYRGETKLEVIVAAWSHFKLCNDPPGFKGSNAEWIEGEGWRPFTAADFAKQRAEAWAFYDRRRALALRCARAQRPHEHWPRALSWTTEDCDQIEAWLAHGGPTPAPLISADLG